MRRGSPVHARPGWRPNREELAWAAGFFEGEGSISSRAQPRPLGGRYAPNPVIHVGQIDTWPLERFCRAVGVGSWGRSTSEGTMHRYQITGFEACQFVMALLWEWLSPRRRARYVRVARAWLEAPRFKADPWNDVTGRRRRAK